MSRSIVMALAGNPNAGKTTMFNALTGSRQQVGNYPGITVDRKEGKAFVGDVKVNIVDLPGCYSLTAYSQEELVARNVLIEERPDVVVDVISATSLERNLYLAVQFLELGIPLVLALNMMDEVRKKGLTIDSARLGKILGIPVVETVARTGQGKSELLERAQRYAVERKGEWNPLRISYGPDVDPVLTSMETKIEESSFLTGECPARWVALKYLEGDEEMISAGRAFSPEVSGELETMHARLTDHCRKTLQTTPEAIIADYRYGFISSLLKQNIITHDQRQRRIDVSDKVDKVVTNRYLGPLIMLLVLYAMFHTTFTFGEYPMGWLESLFGWAGRTVTAVMPDGVLQSLLVSGIIDGVGGVLGFVPLIFIMFILISFFEDLGYMARLAYMLDRIFRIFGLHGCSVMPFIVSGGIAGGCAVPGIMAARTLRSPKEKLATILTAPFMTCGAKLPVFILLTAAFFPRHEALVLFCITLFAWIIALLVARLFRSTIVRGPSTPFVMELPPYRMPTVKGVLIHSWERTWQYIKKAGTVILAVSILLWAMMTYPGLPDSEQERFAEKRAVIEEQIEISKSPERKKDLSEQLELFENMQAQRELKNSLAGRIGTFLEPVSTWAGFDWRTNIALVGGFAAKEVIISTMGTAYSMGEMDPEESQPLSKRIAKDPQWNMISAISLIIFVLLYAPCFVTVITMARESTWKWAVFSLGFNTVLAFGLAVGVYQAGMAF